MHRVRQHRHAPLCSPAPKGEPWSTAVSGGQRRNSLSSRLSGPIWLRQTQNSMSIELSRVAAEGAQPFRVVPADDQTGLVYTTLAQIDHDLAEREDGKEDLEDDTQPLVSGGNSGGNEGPEPSKPSWVPHRWRVVVMMALAFVLCNMDKVNMSVAVIPLSNEFHWSASDRGLVSSAFFWGYTATQIPAGYFATKIGGATVLLAGVAFWSVGTLVAPPAAKFSLLALCVSRVLVGLGEGLAPSSATNVMSRLIPETERTRAVTMVFGSLDVGSVVGLLVCGPLIRNSGWPSVFYLFAAAGLLWCAAWPLLRPDDSDKTQPIPQPPSPSAAKKPVPYWTFMTSVPVWAIITAHFCHNWGYYTLLAWLPSFFELALGLNVESSSLLTLIPYLANVAMTPFVGPVADGLLKRGWDLTHVRKLAQGIAFLGPAICLVGCALMMPTGARETAGAFSRQGTVIIVTLLSISFALNTWSRGGLYCNHQDLSPKYAGALLGISNTAGALPGVLGIASVGFLLDKTSSWGPSLFYPIAFFQLFGLVIYTLFASSVRQQWE